MHLSLPTVSESFSPYCPAAYHSLTLPVSFCPFGLGNLKTVGSGSLELYQPSITLIT